MVYSVPHTEPVPEGGFVAATIVGTPQEGAKRFAVNLVAPNGDIVLHYQCRFDEGCVVRNNTCDGGQWQKEERDGGLPFHPGQKFQLQLINDGNKISCLLDGSSCCEFVVRNGADPNEIAAVTIEGGISLEKVSVQTAAPAAPEPEPVPPAPQPYPQPPPIVQPVAPHPAPAPHPVAPHPTPVAGGGAQPAYVASLADFHKTNRFRIVGIPNANADRFAVNIKSNDGEVLFHFNPRFGQNCVVRNFTQGHQYHYDHEQRSGPCPFAPGRTFALDYIAGPNGQIRCFVDGAEFCQFQMDPTRFSQIAVLEINGDVQIQQVMIA